MTIFGDMFTGAEIWSTGFRIGQEGDEGGNFDVNEAWVDGLKTLWQNVFAGATQNFSGAFRTLGIKAGVVLPTGLMDLTTIYTSTYATPISGGSSNPSYPPQIATVAQLRAASPVGLGAKGRMYLPGFCAPIGSTGHISGSATSQLANDLRSMFDAAETAANSPGYVINASQGRPGVPGTPPVHRRVTSVRVGDVYDTQRRRRNALTEAYAVANLAA